ncbi:MAG: hypothetical protein HY812_18750 [Planctomycetes bacterium]|nr:hypothetical protein [Planctomycetota bacterium]
MPQLASLALPVLAALVLTPGSGTITVETEPGGQVDSPTVAGVNQDGALFWNGGWGSNDTYGHMYFADLDTGLKLKDFTTLVVDANPATLGQVAVVPGPEGMVYTVTKSLYHYGVPDVGGTGTWLYEAVLYDVEMRDAITLEPAGPRARARSRGAGLGTGTAYLEVFIENEDGTTTSLRGDPLLFNHDLEPGDAMMVSVVPCEMDWSLVTPADQYWLDIDGGSEMGGKTFKVKTSALLPGATATENLGSPFISEFAVQYTDAASVLRQIVMLPALSSEMFVPAEKAYVLPKKVKVKPSASKPEKSLVMATGFLDIGPGNPNMTGPFLATVGTVQFPMPGLVYQNGKFSVEDGGLCLTITPAKSGSSKAKFKLKVKGASVAGLDPNVATEVGFLTAGADGSGTVLLKKGAFKLGKVKGTLIEPNLFLYSAKAKLKGAGKDSLKLTLGLATLGGMPAVAPELSLNFGENLQVTVPSASFKKKGKSVWQAKGPKGSLTSVKLDYARETLTINGSNLSLGDFAAGPHDLTAAVGLGADARSVAVRMVKKGSSLKY